MQVVADCNVAGATAREREGRLRGERNKQGRERETSGDTEGMEGTVAGAVETRRADTEWKESMEGFARIPVCASVCADSHAERKVARKGRDGETVVRKKSPG